VRQAIRSEPVKKADQYGRKPRRFGVPILPRFGGPAGIHAAPSLEGVASVTYDVPALWSLPEEFDGSMRSAKCLGNLSVF
jgi:hypothetical protein